MKKESFNAPAADYFTKERINNEINYIMAKTIACKMRTLDLISDAEYDNFMSLNFKTFPPLYSEISLEISTIQSDECNKEKEVSNENN